MFHINKEVKIFFNYVVGPVLGVWLFYSLYRQIQLQPNLRASLLQIRAAASHSFWKITAVLIMIFLNWGIEARKWQILVKMIQPLSFYKAFKGVLSGVALTINTPNRIGEYGGRILFVNDGNRLRAISLSIAGSLSQLIITLIMGSLGLSYLLVSAQPGTAIIMGLSIYWIKVLLATTLVSSLIVSLLFFRLSLVLFLLDKFPILAKYRYLVAVLDQFSLRRLLMLLYLSFFRYLTFVIQYIILLSVFSVNVTFAQSFWSISVLYLILALVPSIAIAELGIRGKLSVALLSLYSGNIVGIMGSTFGIWFLNLFIPAITGSIFILSNRYLKTNRKSI